MSEDAGASVAWKAPYLSYETLDNFFERKIGSHPLPPRIDSYFLDNYAGSVRPLLMGALRTMGMLGDNNEVLDPLRIAAQGAEARKKVLREWAEDFYVEQVDLARQHATAQMLWESFGRHKLSGSTLRKAVVFYLSLSADVGLPLSAHFRAPKAAATSRPQTGRATGGSAAEADTQEQTTPPVGGPVRGETRVVTLGEAGTVTVTVDVRWLDLPDETFAQLRRLVREITDLGIAGTPEPEEPEV